MRQEYQKTEVNNNLNSIDPDSYVPLQSNFNNYTIDDFQNG